MKILMFVEQAYSIGVLSPVAKEAADRGFDVAWFALDTAANDVPGTKIRTLAEARHFGADAVIVPGNWVPRGLGRISVQIFHGLAFEKKGHFRIRGFFDLYCTPGPTATDHYRHEAERLGYFAVAETGWPKLDPFAEAARSPHRPSAPLRVLYAPTFSPNLTSLPHLLPEWQRLARDPRIALRVKFHPITDPALMDLYRAALPDGSIAATEGNVMDCIAWSDIVVSDTSSTIREAQWMGRPVITYRTAAPDDHALDITDAAGLEGAILSVAQDYDIWRERGLNGLADAHPYRDGKSAVRVLDAICRHLDHPPALKRKPLNLLRHAKVWWRMTKLDKEVMQS